MSGERTVPLIPPGLRGLSGTPSNCLAAPPSHPHYADHRPISMVSMAAGTFHSRMTPGWASRNRPSGACRIPRGLVLGTTGCHMHTPNGLAHQIPPARQHQTVAFRLHTQISATSRGTGFALTNTMTLYAARNKSLPSGSSFSDKTRCGRPRYRNIAVRTTTTYRRHARNAQRLEPPGLTYRIQWSTAAHDQSVSSSLSRWWSP